MMQIESDCAYTKAFNGRFSGVLRWPQFETLWQALAANPEGWFVYEPEAGPAPIAPLSVKDMQTFLREAEIHVREGCTLECCGAIYADSLTEPGFIKVYNPRLMGGCGMGKAPLPQWLISRMEPVSLIEHERVPVEEGILSRFLGQ